MYIPDHFEEQRVAVLQDLIRLHPFATFVATANADLWVHHIPLTLQLRGQFGTLVGHVARANPIWQQLGAINAVAIFQGPQSYISPSWYPSKHAHGKAVPTWNYVAVHAHGRPRVVQDREWLLAQVSQMTAQHEAKQALPWKVSDAPPDFTDRLLAGIVGIEMTIEVLRGSWKVSQNRTLADRLGVAAGLESRQDAQSQALAQLVMRGSAASRE